MPLHRDRRATPAMRQKPPAPKGSPWEARWTASDGLAGHTSPACAALLASEPPKAISTHAAYGYRP